MGENVEEVSPTLGFIIKTLEWKHMKENGMEDVYRLNICSRSQLVWQRSIVRY